MKVERILFLDSSFLSLYYRGLSFIELLIVLAIFSISLSLVGPNINRYIAQNAITAKINDTNALIQQARYLAINHQETMTLCPSSNFATCSIDWNNGLIGFIDQNKNNDRDNQERLLFASQKVTHNITIKGPKSPIRFHESGMNSSATSLLFCPPNTDLTLARAIILSMQGRTRLSNDSNNDGIHEVSPGRNIICK